MNIEIVEPIKFEEIVYSFDEIGEDAEKELVSYIFLTNISTDGVLIKRE